MRMGVFMDMIGIIENKQLNIKDSNSDEKIDSKGKVGGISNHNAIDYIRDRYIVDNDMGTGGKDFLYTWKEENKDKEEVHNPETKKETAENRWNSLMDRMSEEDFKILLEEDNSINDKDIDIIEKTIERIKAQRKEKKENLESQKESYKEKLEAVRNSSTAFGVGKEIVEQLEEKGLPVTKDNIAKISAALEMAAVIPNLPEQGMAYLIENNKEPTIENIYKAVHLTETGNERNVQRNHIDEATWSNLQKQVNTIIEDAGLIVDEETLGEAQWLLQNNISITGNHLWALKDLKLIKNGSSNNELMNRIIDSVAKGQAPEEILLSFVQEVKVEQIINDFQSINPNVIDYLLENPSFFNLQEDAGDIDVNLQQLKETEKLLESENNIENNEELNDPRYFDIKTITLRRNLEEIRLKLTVESGKQLIKNGIHPETHRLSEIVDGLREIENNYYYKLLKEGNISVNETDLNTLKTSLHGVDELEGMPASILGNTLSRYHLQTVNGLLEVGRKCIKNKSLTDQSYETLMTKPRTDMGDRIEKAFQNIEAILEDLGLENIETNKRAVRILGYNEMEINQENINKIKEYDSQVNYMMKHLHPAVTVEFIKRGKNPLDIPIEELNNEIKEIREDFDEIQDEKFSKYLWKLDKNHKISEEERESYIGIYRLLHVVDKTKGAALGAVVKADKNLTLNHLLTSVRTIKKRNIDTQVNEQSGAIEQVNWSSDRIDNQINAGFKTNKGENEGNTGISKYNRYLINEILEELSPEKLKQIMQEQDIYSVPLEYLKDKLQDLPANHQLDKEYISMKINELQDIIAEGKEEIEFLDKLQLPYTINNIKATMDYFPQDQNFYKKWNQFLKENSSEAINNQRVQSISENMIEQFNSPQEVMGEYENLEKQVNQIVSDLYSDHNISSESLNQLQRISNGVTFLKNLASKESYEIPILIGEKITNVNVTILKNTTEKGKLKLHLNSNQLGNITASFQVEGDQVKGLITCDNYEGLDIMDAMNNQLISEIEDLGIQCKYIFCSLESMGKGNLRLHNIEPLELINTQEVQDKSLYDNEIKEQQKEQIHSPSTKLLYQVGKKILIHIKKVESTYDTL